MHCYFCKAQRNFLKQYTHWSLELHRNQCYLGRTILALNRHIEDLAELNPAEQQELFSILPNLKHALTQLFDPDFLNYASLGNETRHLHIHIIPRYSRPVKFANHTFKDLQWGQNYSPYDKTFELPKDVYHQVEHHFTNALKST